MRHHTTPKIYVADLAAYNAGHLRGRWLYLPEYEDVDELMNAISCLLDEWDRDLLDGMTGPVEEWAVHDFEGFPRALYSEYPGRDGLRAMLCYVELLSYTDDSSSAEKFVEIAEDIGYDPEEWEDGFARAYRGTFKSAEYWAMEYVESAGLLNDMPENLRYYFDYEAFARDVRISGDMRFCDVAFETVHVFDEHAL